MTSISDRFYSSFPREFGLKRRVMKTKSSFWDAVNLHNGKMNCYTNLYDYKEHTEWGKPIFDSAIWDRVIWDFDGDNSFELTKQVSDHLTENNILHTNVFSGRGYHIYSFIDPALQSPQFAIRGYQTEVCRELGIPLSVSSGLDPTSIANGTKIIRIIGTMNTRAEGRRACLGIPKTMLQGTHDSVRDYAKKPHSKLWALGKVAADLAPFDSESINFATKYDSDIDFEFEGVPIIEEQLPPCIMSILKDENVKDDGRQIVASYLSFAAREGIDPQNLTFDAKSEATDIVMQALDEFGQGKKWKRYMPRRRVANVIDNILNPYSCNRTEQLGLCCEPNCKFADGGSKL
jgi:hypothetical protein